MNGNPEDVAAAAAALASVRGQRSPDSSSPVTLQSTPVYQGQGPTLQCPQCPTVLANEWSLTAHLQQAHRVHLVVSKDAMAAGQVTTTTSTSRLSSCASSLTASPKDNETSAVCPVCRLQVDDLSRHFAAAHTSKPASPLGPSPAVTAAMAMVGAMAALGDGAATLSPANVLPPVVLPNHPLPPATALTASDLQQKLLSLKEETKVHVSNLHSTMLQVLDFPLIIETDFLQLFADVPE